ITGSAAPARPASGGGARPSAGAERGAPAASAGAASVAPTSERQRIGFVRTMAPRLQDAARQLGVSVNSLVAQAALETGWGLHVPGDGNGGAGAGSAIAGVGHDIGTGDAGPSQAGSSGAGSTTGGGGTSSFNLFGIKTGASWTGAAVRDVTTEYRQGAPGSAVQSFRAYGSLQQGIDDYVNLLQGQPRYRAALGTGNNVGAFATALAQGGYATDPDYVSKLVATATEVASLRGETLKVAGGAPIQPSGEPA
ncbi:MAG: glycoside hydrolase family 73 protein, partial [Solirubrobacteraceae bacterium]